jgi:hypothetical protein
VAVQVERDVVGADHDPVPGAVGEVVVELRALRDGGAAAHVARGPAGRRVLRRDGGSQNGDGRNDGTQRDEQGESTARPDGREHFVVLRFES